jgi:hypothetical protein
VNVSQDVLRSKKHNKPAAMPIFEEKVICPFAIRFSQDHIRPEFQTGCDIESAIKAIKTKKPRAQKTDYDVILEPPFPAIEIMRGHLKGDEVDHWLSLDNRRLYCLQKAAVALWPQRVAVAVEALRAPTDGIRKKVNSSVHGLSVGIGHSPKTLIGRWNWREAVESMGGSPSELVSQHEECMLLVDLDDARVSIQDLLDAEAAPSMIDLFFQKEENKTMSDASTTEPRSPRGSEGSNSLSPPRESTGAMEASEWMPKITGNWKDKKGTLYKITVASSASWACLRKTACGARRKFTLWYDEATDSVSWGDDWSYWADASEFRDGADAVNWYGQHDAKKRKSRFQWCRSQD